jgi:hypothetical protein
MICELAGKILIDIILIFKMTTIWNIKMLQKRLLLLLFKDKRDTYEF